MIILHSEMATIWPERPNPMTEAARTRLFLGGQSYKRQVADFHALGECIPDIQVANVHAQGRIFKPPGSVLSHGMLDA